MNSWSTVLIAALALCLTVRQCAGFKCYVCSWSPASPNRTDICTTENFNKNAAQVFDGCPYGCELVAVYNSNGELENFYRNCLVKGKEMTNDCRNQSTQAIRKRICRCDWDLCNAAAASSPALLCTLVAVILTISLAARQ